MWALSILVSRSLRRARLPTLPALPQAPERVFRTREECREYPAVAGVNVFAYFRGQFGLGESARLYAGALIDAGYPVALNDIAIDVPHGFDERSLERYIGVSAPHRINLLFVNPDYLAEALASIESAKQDGRYVIACWFWELECIPQQWLWALDKVDEIMVASAFVERAFRRVTDKPILRVPIPLTEVADSGLNREQFGLPADAFIFLNTFDFNSWWARKNPLDVINAFQRAFPPRRDDVRLLIKSSNGHRYPARLHQLLVAAAGDRRVLVRDEIIDRRHMRALHRCVDAYVSLHRAEGFGLGMAEAMALGKPVVATAWSGNLEFMTPENSCLVDYRLVPVGHDEYVHAENAQWAQADIDHAARLMRRIVDDPTFAAEVGKRAASDIRVTLSPVAAAEKMIARLNQVSTTLLARTQVDV
jgi:glycosyltransferase involved in cell wall biosynthesis